MKNPDSERSKKLIPYLQTLKRVILLTGTPVLNKNVEVFSLLKILRPDNFDNFSEFQKYFCGRGYFCKYRKEVVYKAITKTGEFRQVFNSIALRRLKSEVLAQLPPKIRHRVLIKMTNASNCVINSSNSTLLTQLGNLDINFMTYGHKNTYNPKKT